MTQEEKSEHIATIAHFPSELAKLVDGLSPEQLTTVYIPGEWTIAQNVHHVVDSHINSYIRLKLILTEDHPPLKGYDQDAWALLPDATDEDISTSMMILHSFHRRWVQVWENVQDDQWNRPGMHSELGEITLAELLPTYAEHCDAHIQQVTEALKAGGLR